MFTFHIQAPRVRTCEETPQMQQPEARQAAAWNQAEDPERSVLWFVTLVDFCAVAYFRI
jgi:hypothetical protein